ncbi:MAG: hypothetical protein ACP5U2_01095 [Bryobacteraceae bacterium]
MIRAVDIRGERFLADLERIQQRVDAMQRQISSGLRVSSPSDAPDHVVEILSVRARLDLNRQIQTNLSRAKAEVETADQALQQAVKVVERALQLGVQGANATQTAATRKMLGTEVRGLLEQMVALADTQAEGRYLFSGDRDQIAPYSLDLESPNGVSQYAGAPATREVLHPAGTRFLIARSGDEIFDHPDASVFAALNALRAALENGPTVAEGEPGYQEQFAAQTEGIEQALGDLRKAHAHLNVQLGFYGAVENKIADAATFADRAEVREQNLLSVLRDADIVTAALSLSQALNHQQAALAAGTRLRSGSLFDYLA